MAVPRWWCGGAQRSARRAGESGRRRLLSRRSDQSHTVAVVSVCAGKPGNPSVAAEYQSDELHGRLESVRAASAGGIVSSLGNGGLQHAATVSELCVHGNDTTIACVGQQALAQSLACAILAHLDCMPLSEGRSPCSSWS